MPRLRNVYKIFDADVRAKNIQALRYWTREALWPILRIDSPDPIFIVGCSRAGTTVTFETLAHSGSFVSFGYELPQFWNSLWGPSTNGWESEAALCEHARPEHRAKALRHFYARLGRGWVLDKTCINVMRIPFLHALFPQAKFVYVHRDGRDNVSSLMDGWRDGRFALTKFLGRFPSSVRIDGGHFKEWHFFLPPGWREYNEASLEEVCAYQWSTANRMALQTRRNVPEAQWIPVRYEDIFDCPVDLFRDIFERLGIPFGEDMEKRCLSLNRRPTSIVSGPPARRKWRGHNREAVEHIQPAIAPVMDELGYRM